jgi:hypothetical protein
MTHCNNCGHSETFVLLVQFALAVPGPDALGEAQAPSETSSNPVGASSNPSEGRSDDADHRQPPSPGDCSLAVQCPVCDSTDVAVGVADLLARYGSSTTS